MQFLTRNTNMFFTAPHNYLNLSTAKHHSRFINDRRRHIKVAKEITPFLVNIFGAEGYLIP